ncbi:hypothetical protein CQW23_34000 [Capsicum baccatum]|uniref:Uncharacterized protein n=1 Tax=Capsicum baccatum TaxID=33114 RepID=A0A2G2V094_CAPBA|nr:hypothetical protein CQW23_34000 [Capsicum baccatum]
MAALPHSDSRRKYSWWWDSHSPKNSKWLQDNLTDLLRMMFWAALHNLKSARERGYSSSGETKSYLLLTEPSVRGPSSTCYEAPVFGGGKLDLLRSRVAVLAFFLEWIEEENSDENVFAFLMDNTF